MADRPRLEAVLLDAGGTLGRLDFEWMAERLSAMGVPMSAARLRHAELEGRRRYDASAERRRRGAPPPPRIDAPPLTDEPDPPLGTVGDTLAYFGGMLDAAGVPADRREAVLEALYERQREHGLWSRVMEGARAALEGLRDLGLRRAIVSNSDGRAAEHVAAWGLLDLVEFVVDSHVVAVEKPDPRIVTIGLERLGVAADRALFVGDIRSVDEAVAAAAGTPFVLIDPSAGAYAGSGTPYVTTIADLPRHVAQRFDVASSTPTPHAAPPTTRGGCS